MAWFLHTILALLPLEMLVSNYLIVGQLLSNVCDLPSSSSVSAPWSLVNIHCLSKRITAALKSLRPGCVVVLPAEAQYSVSLSCTLFQLTNLLSPFLCVSSLLSLDEIDSKSFSVAGGVCGRLEVRVPEGQCSWKGLWLEDSVRPPPALRHRHGWLRHQPEAHPFQATGIF